MLAAEPAERHKIVERLLGRSDGSGAAPFDDDGEESAAPKSMSFAGITPDGAGIYQVTASPMLGGEALEPGSLSDEMLEMIREALVSGSFKIFTHSDAGDDDDDNEDDGDGERSPRYTQVDSGPAKSLMSNPMFAEGLVSALRSAAGGGPKKAPKGGADVFGRGLLEPSLSEDIPDDVYAVLAASTVPCSAPDVDVEGELLAALGQGLSREALLRALEQAPKSGVDLPTLRGLLAKAAQAPKAKAPAKTAAATKPKHKPKSKP